MPFRPFRSVRQGLQALQRTAGRVARKVIVDYPRELDRRVRQAIRRDNRARRESGAIASTKALTRALESIKEGVKIRWTGSVRQTSVGRIRGWSETFTFTVPGFSGEVKGRLLPGGKVAYDVPIEREILRAYRGSVNRDERARSKLNEIAAGMGDLVEQYGEFEHGETEALVGPVDPISKP